MIRDIHAEKRVSALWANFQRPALVRPTRTLMEIVSFDRARRIVVAKDEHGTVSFQGNAIPTHPDKFTFDHLVGHTAFLYGQNVACEPRRMIVVEDRLGQVRFDRFARSIEVKHRVATYAPSYTQACGGYSILHRIRMFHNNGKVEEVIKTYYNGNSQSFSVPSIAKRHFGKGVWAVEVEIPENSPGYYGTLLNPGGDSPICRMTYDTVSDAYVREDWNVDTGAWEFHVRASLTDALTAAQHQILRGLNGLGHRISTSSVSVAAGRPHGSWALQKLTLLYRRGMVSRFKASHDKGWDWEITVAGREAFQKHEDRASRIAVRAA